VEIGQEWVDAAPNGLMYLILMGLMGILMASKSAFLQHF